MTVAQQLFDAVESHAISSGHFERVNTAEPKSAPGNGLAAAIWLSAIGPAGGASGLNATTGRIELSVRLYTGMLTDPPDMIDPNLTQAAIDLMTDYSGDFGLSIVDAFNVRMIDLLGAHGTGLSANAGYINQDGSLFRVITITLPIVVNDLWSQTA